MSGGTIERWIEGKVDHQKEWVPNNYNKNIQTWCSCKWLNFLSFLYLALIREMIGMIGWNVFCFFFFCAFDWSLAIVIVLWVVSCCVRQCWQLAWYQKVSKMVVVLLLRHFLFFFPIFYDWVSPMYCFLFFLFLFFWAHLGSPMFG